MFKDYSNSSTIISLISFKKIEKEKEASLEWMEDGEICFTLNKVLNKFYSESNKIMSYKFFDQKRILVGDSLGSIRIFEKSKIN